MQKIKNSIVDRMIEQKCTANEITFLLYISMFQDLTGRVTGVHYKDVCDATNMSIQGYYDVKESLESKGFVKCEKNDYSDCDITIVGNAYNGEEYNRAGYINTNHNIFFCKEFQELKAGAKLLAMKLMIITFSGKGYFEIGVKKFYDKENGYQKRFDVSSRVMRSYLMSLKPLFSIGIKDGKYYIEPKKIIYRKAGTKEETERFREKAVEVVLRRSRIKDPGAGEQEIYSLFKQYDAKAEVEKKQLVSLIDRAVKKSLEILNKGKSWIKYKIINIKLIHKLLCEEWSKNDKQQDAKESLSEDPSENDNERVEKDPVIEELMYRATHPKAAQRMGDAGEKKYKKNNKFNNFNQREYDMEALEKLLLLTDPRSLPTD